MAEHDVGEVLRLFAKLEYYILKSWEVVGKPGVAKLSLRVIALHGIYESNFIIIVIDNKLFDNNNVMFV